MQHVLMLDFLDVVFRSTHFYFMNRNYGLDEILWCNFGPLAAISAQWYAELLFYVHNYFLFMITWL